MVSAAETVWAGEDTESEYRDSEFNERWGTPPVLSDAYVFALFGKRGSGKTATMIKWGRDERREHGKNVWYWPEDLKFKYGKAISGVELLSLPKYLEDGVVLIDEIQEMAPSNRTVSSRNQMLGSFLRQVRKRRLNVYYTSNEHEILDHSLARHTSIHYFCELVKDNRCYVRGYHMRSCDDHVKLRSVDTNREFGIDTRYYDGRRRGKHVVWKIRDVYGVYNTGAVADYAEVSAINKDAILSHREEKQAGIPFGELCETLRTVWIPWAVEQGHEQVVPSVFATNVNRRFNLQVSAETMGRAFAEIGLQTSRKRVDGTVSRVVTLPPASRLKAWQEGFWSPE